MTNPSVSHTEENLFFSAFFSDETERYRSPAEPEPGQRFTVGLRTPKLPELTVSVHMAGQDVPMVRTDAGPRFDRYEAELVCPRYTLEYCFHIQWDGKYYTYQKNGLHPVTVDWTPESDFFFRFTPGFHTPDWAKGAVMYQILPDRFRNGDPGNDVQDGEYSYNHSHVRRVADWDSPPPVDGYRQFYGGDLDGILEKLDYLQDLGVEVLYLNPIFLSPSSHKYDTQDYEHVDPHFGVITEDVEYRLQDWEQHNGYARRYITRVLSRKNLEQSDALFARLCQELHRRGMKIILDGVFNHCGSFHRWMDREGLYLNKPGYLPGAFQDRKSPYRSYFRFTKEKPGYEAWWGFDSLPKLNYENDPELVDSIINIACHWAQPPYSIDGWRLDVGADLGHSPAYNHSFWREFRRRLKQVNPDLLILAEHYGDPSPWLGGDQWDTVMNYDAFMEPVSFFLTGMEKHSDHYLPDLYQDGPFFFAEMEKKMARFECGSLYCAMNELSNHDHSRFLTRTNHRTGRVEISGSAAAGEGIDKTEFMSAVMIQMTWPGAPTIYYADEAGQVGWTDPDNRRTYPWGHEDTQLLALHRALTALRRAHPVLRTGSLKSLGAGRGWIAYGRFDDRERVVTVCSNSAEPLELELPVWTVGAGDGERFTLALSTGEQGPRTDMGVAFSSEGGCLRLTIPARSSYVLVSGETAGE